MSNKTDALVILNNIRMRVEQYADSLENGDLPKAKVRFGQCEEQLKRLLDEHTKLEKQQAVKEAIANDK